ncbi:MAG: glycerol-3-phosphate ABC transporter permease [Spirochaetae bacterium HGW-Spirochaetae-8]|nr:MAG: glycerol-3-phosphate ABC transporter permease [Spirochaetae bacterium HGW-Spirochaetae-8]
MGKLTSVLNQPQHKPIKITPYLLLLPAFTLFSLFTFWPFFKTIILSFSFTDKRGNFVEWVGFSNYIRVLAGSLFRKVMGNTFMFALMIGIGTVVTAMFLSLVSASREKCSRVYEVMFSLPMAVASAPASSIFIFMMRKENGVLNKLLGTEYAWLQDPNWALLAVAIVTVWLSIGASYIFLLVGFRNVPEELLESATLDGAGPLKKTFKILIPLASPQIFFVVFLNISNSFKAFTQIKLLTEGGPNNATNTLIYSMYKNAIMNNRYETACVQAILLFLVIFIVTRIQNAFESRTVFY